MQTTENNESKISLLQLGEKTTTANILQTTKGSAWQHTTCLSKVCTMKHKYNTGRDVKTWQL